MTESQGSVAWSDRALMRSTPTRVNCTHTSMDMVYSQGDCDVCHSPSTFGWLYKCQQDQIQALSRSSSAQWKPRGDLDASILQEFAKLGFSRSILCQVADGHYTVQQMNKLKQQKINVTNIVGSQTTMLDGDVQHDQRASPILSLHPNVTIRAKRGIAKDDRQVQMTALAALQADLCCTLQCCHRCRPYYKDRVYASLNAIIGDTDAADCLVFCGSGKLLDPRIVRRVGLKKHPGLSKPADSPTDAISASSSYLSLLSSGYAVIGDTADFTANNSPCTTNTGHSANTRANEATISSLAIDASNASSARDYLTTPATVRGRQSHSPMSRLLTMAKSASQRPMISDRGFTMSNLVRKSRALPH